MVMFTKVVSQRLFEWDKLHNGSLDSKEHCSFDFEFSTWDSQLILQPELVEHSFSTSYIKLCKSHF